MSREANKKHQGASTNGSGSQTPRSPPVQDQRRQFESIDRASLEAYQLRRLNALLAAILPTNKLYAAKLAGLPRKLEILDQLADFPLTTQEELLPVGQGSQVASNRTFAAGEYVRFHQTSGSRGRPLSVYDTADDWRWWIDCWQYVLDVARITPDDRAMLAFSFGPFIGFWSAFDALVARGTMVVPGGGMGSLARLDLIERQQTTALFCTPTYALRLAQVATENQITLADSPIEKIIVAGEPGGSVPAIRERIEQAWNAKVIDHAGATEVGAWGYGDRAGRGLYVAESEFIAEFLPVDSGAGKPDSAGGPGLSHLVLTTLGRTGAPVIRYQTGDLVRPVWSQGDGNPFVFLEGGVLGRSDDRMVIRGMNLIPTAIEQILHSFPEVVEYRLTASKQGEMDSVRIEVEDHLQQPERIAKELHRRLGLRIEVHLVPKMSLPRFEGKGNRFIDERCSPP